MKEFDIEFEVNQKTIYSMSVEAETPEQAVEIASGDDFDRHEAEEDCMLESYDDVHTMKCTGEYGARKDGTRSLNRFEEPVRKKDEALELWEKYKSTNGNKCPQCDSDKITGLNFSMDNLDAWRNVICLKCDTTWREFFTMTYMEIL